MSAPTWTVIGSIEPSASWSFTDPTDANAFKFDYQQPPARCLLQVAQTDGSVWLFEPRSLASDRGSQVLLLDDNGVFAETRRIGLRFAIPTATAPGWIVTVSAATLAGQTIASLSSKIDTVSMQVSTLNENFQTATAQTIASLQTLLLDVNLLLSTATPAPTPTPTPTPTPQSPPSAAGVVYTVSQSDVFNNITQFIGTYQNLTDGDLTTGAVCSGGDGKWIQITFPSLVVIANVSMTRGNFSGVGGDSIDGRTFQTSVDGQNWTDVFTINGVPYDGTRKVFPLSPALTTQYIRLFGAYYTGVAELVFT